MRSISSCKVSRLAILLGCGCYTLMLNCICHSINTMCVLLFINESPSLDFLQWCLHNLINHSIGLNAPVIASSCWRMLSTRAVGLPPVNYHPVAVLLCKNLKMYIYYIISSTDIQGPTPFPSAKSVPSKLSHRIKTWAV